MITLPVTPANIDLLDPLGYFRREGAMPASVPVAESTDGAGSAWTPKTATESYRICKLRNRIYRKDVAPYYYGGYRITYIALANRGLQVAHEWLYDTVGRVTP